jgi:tetratricopeptide (TPR) repeat protein
MSRWQISLALSAVLASGLCAQEKKPSAVLPPPKDQPKDQKSTPQTPDPEQLPPEEDVAAIKQEYSFNPVRSRRDVEVGNFYFKKGDWKAAAGRFKEATLWNEGNAEAWLRWGETEEKRGVASAAKAAYEKYLAMAPDAKNVVEIKRRLEKLK